MTTLRKVLALAALTGWLVCADASAVCVSAPEMAPPRTPGLLQTGMHIGEPQSDADGAAGPTRHDHHGRVIAPVTINGQGPFRFIVDTGANRSVLSQPLAAALGLVPSGAGNVHSIEGVQVAPLVNVASLNYGAVELANSSLPILDGLMLGNEQGLLGVDGMHGKRLRLDFERRCIEIIPSRTAPHLRGWVEMRGQLRFGDLVVIPGTVGSVRVNVMIDTGADVSLANVAFSNAVQRVRTGRDPESIQRAYTAGHPIVLGGAVIVPQLRLGTVSISGLTAYIGDYHIFQLWGLIEEPTILVGMDVLQHVRGIAIDYERGLVHLRQPLTMF